MNYFTIDELTYSAVARKLHIDNTPPAPAVANMQALIHNVLNPAREAFGSTVWVNSGYRCEQLNNAVGGSRNSSHLRGEAADLSTGSPAGNKRLYEILLSLPHDQLIWERGNAHGPAWIHVSYRRSGANRNQSFAL